MTRIQNNKRKNVQLILMVLAFLIPVIAAKILLSSNYKGEVKTHGGQLLNLKTTYHQLVEIPNKNRQWRVVYFTNQACREHCIEQLYFVAQTYRALGRLQNRVAIGAIANNTLSETPDYLTNVEFSQDILKSPQQSLEDSVVIIDPLGNLVMSYQLLGSKQQRLKKSHDMLLDIKQLLKLSRIG